MTFPPVSDPRTEVDFQDFYNSREHGRVPAPDQPAQDLDSPDPVQRGGATPAARNTPSPNSSRAPKAGS